MSLVVVAPTVLFH